MRDLLESLDRIIEAPVTDKSGKPVTSKSGPVKQGSGPAPRNTSYKNVGDMVKAITTPGRQGFDDPNKSAAAVKAATAPAPKPKLGGTGVGRQDGPAALRPAPVQRTGPVGGPRRQNPIDPQAMAATKAAASVVNTPKPAEKPKMAAPAPRAKVKATAANTKDFDKTVALQKKLGVTADGIMGPETRRAMQAAKAKQAEPTKTARTPTPTDAGEFATARTPTPTDAGEFATAASPKAFTPVAGAGDRKPGATDRELRVNKSNNALRRDFGKVKDAGKSMLSRIAGAFTGGGNRRAERDAENQASAQAYRDRIGTTRTATAAGPNAAGSNFRTAADGSISRTDNVRQPGDLAPSLARRGDDQQRVRDRMRAALAAGSTDPDDIRAYQRRLANSRGTGVAGGTDPDTI